MATRRRREPEQARSERAKPEPAEPEQLVLTDPRAMRAIAHPARTAVIDELYGGTVRTASELAALTALTPSAMSYHLRALEKWGIVRRAESGGDGRERPWRRAAKGVSWSGKGVSPTTRDAIAGRYLDQLRGDIGRWAQHRERESGGWRDLGLINRGFLYLTAEETARLDQMVVDAVHDLVGDRTADNHPDGARRVAFFWATAPTVDDAVDDAGER